MAKVVVAARGFKDAEEQNEKEALGTKGVAKKLQKVEIINEVHQMSNLLDVLPLRGYSKVWMGKAITWKREHC